MLVIGRPRFFCFTVLAGSAVMPLIIETQLPGMRAVAYGCLVVVLAIPLVAWNWYVRIDDDGLEQRANFKCWRLVWADIERIVITDGEDVTITVMTRGGGSRRLWSPSVDMKVEKALRQKVEVVGSMWGP